MELAATADGFRRRRRRRWLSIVGVWAGVAAIVTGAAVLPVDPDAYIGLQVMPVLILLIVLPVQLFTLACGRRERRILESYGWEPYPCEIRYRRRHVEVRLHTEPGSVAVLTPRMMRPHVLRISTSKHPEEAWFCGDMRYGGVLSPVGAAWPVRYVRDKRPKKRTQREPFPGADELAARSGAVGSAY